MLELVGVRNANVIVEAVSSVYCKQFPSSEVKSFQPSGSAS